MKIKNLLIAAISVLMIGTFSSCGDDDQAGALIDDIIGDYVVVGVAPNNCLNPNTLGKVRATTVADQVTLQIIDASIGTITYVANITGSNSLTIDASVSPLESPGLIISGTATVSGDIINFTYVTAQFSCDTRWTKQ